MKRKGIPIVISAPSGTGKSTVCRKLLKQMDNAVFSISYTTRAPRSGEVDGREYYFISEEQFREMIGRGEFIEWAEVHGNLYGTGKKATLELLESGKDVLFDIDIQGARSIRKVFPQECLSIFLVPPTWETLVKRLTSRGTETKEVIERRLQTARRELPAAREFDYIVVNDILDQTVEVLKQIIKIQKYRTVQMNPTLERLEKEMNEFFEKRK